MSALDTPPVGLFAPVSHDEHRAAARETAACPLWMIDHDGSTVLPCQCLDRSETGMRLRVPLGYGVAEGQRYELRSHRPGDGGLPEFGFVNSRWITIVRAQIQLETRDHLDVGATFDEHHPS